jgi:formylglycine-generating enzyme required for sulfatase activity
VINVSWDDAIGYARWLSERTRRCFRLPSEAEWEYAARAGGSTPYGTGVSITTAQANFDGVDPAVPETRANFRGQPATVGSYPAVNGLYDMHGNVAEWVMDCRSSRLDQIPLDGRASYSGDCTMRARRGGSWGSPITQLRSGNRDFRERSARDILTGFRLLRDLEQERNGQCN